MRVCYNMRMKELFDILIKNVSVIDGSGAPAFDASIGMADGKIKIFRDGQLPAAGRVIDGTGLTAVPGFIDSHSHGDLMVTDRFSAASKLTQGFTSQIAGQCGYSAFPCHAGEEALWKSFLTSVATHPSVPPKPAEDAASYAPWHEWESASGIPLTTYSLVGHGTLRLWAMGYDRRKPTAEELQKMCDMLRQCMREGAKGLSTGLVYAPCVYAEEEELVALLNVVREENGVFTCHPYNESDESEEALAQAIRLAGLAGVPLCESHFKSCGRQNWGKPHRMLEQTRAARANGQRIMLDCYPYIAGATALNISIPPRWFENGLTGLTEALADPVRRAAIREEMDRHEGYENFIVNCGGLQGVYVTSCPDFHDAEGMFVTDYAAKTGQDPFDAYCDILVKNGCHGLAVYFHMNEDDVAEILADPWCAVGTDGLLGLPAENPHPRTFGTTARAFDLVVRQKKLVSAEEMIRKMTSLPATFFGLDGKGFIRDGYDADVVLLDLPAFRDRATWDNGTARTEGIRRLFKAGKEIDLEEYR